MKELNEVSSGEELLDVSMVIDPDVCSVCSFDVDNEGWIGCNYCERWFYKRCIDGIDDLLMLTDKEVKALDFKCKLCIHNKL